MQRLFIFLVFDDFALIYVSKKFRLRRKISPLFKRDGYLNAAVIFGKYSGYFFKILRSKKKKTTVIYRQK